MAAREDWVAMEFVADVKLRRFSFSKGEHWISPADSRVPGGKLLEALAAGAKAFDFDQSGCPVDAVRIIARGTYPDCLEASAKRRDAMTLCAVCKAPLEPHAHNPNLLTCRNEWNYGGYPPAGKHEPYRAPCEICHRKNCNSEVCGEESGIRASHRYNRLHAPPMSISAEAAQ